MLGNRLRSERNHSCRYACCTRTDAAFKRKSKHERMRSKEQMIREIIAEDRDLLDRLADN